MPDHAIIGKVTKVGFLAPEYRQKTSTDCLKTACAILSSELPDVDTEDLNSAIRILRGAGITIRCICQTQYKNPFGDESHSVEVLGPGLFHSALEAHPGVLVEDPTKGQSLGDSQDHALASSGTMTADPRDGIIVLHEPGVRITKKFSKAAILFPNLSAARCEQRILSMKEQ
jgi:hypothetical protein